ncbi:MAG: Tetratricopeptide 2 repeat-containing protein [Gemmatimonadetes bacterium]|nr:Tetratricopeptide 2 repeat-containing protein [Gemmatimonadota bacterium]
MTDHAELLQEGMRAERLGVLDRALELFGQVARDARDPDLASDALSRLANVHRLRCDWTEALTAAHAAQRIAREAGLPMREHEAMNAEAGVHMERGDLSAAMPIFARVVEESRDDRLRGLGQQNIGSLHAREGRLDEAERAFASSVVSFERAGYQRGLAIALNNQGRAALDRGQAAEAERLLGRAVRAARQVHDEELASQAMVNLAAAVLERGDVQVAEDFVATALGHFRESGNQWREIECLRLLGRIGSLTGGGVRSNGCYARALHLAARIGATDEVAAIEREMRELGLEAEPGA